MYCHDPVEEDRLQTWQCCVWFCIGIQTSWLAQRHTGVMILQNFFDLMGWQFNSKLIMETPWQLHMWAALLGPSLQFSVDARSLSLRKIMFPASIKTSNNASIEGGRRYWARREDIHNIDNSTWAFCTERLREKENGSQCWQFKSSNLFDERRREG